MSAAAWRGPSETLATTTDTIAKARGGPPLPRAGFWGVSDYLDMGEDHSELSA
jgi:hypothetical protein